MRVLVVDDEPLAAERLVRLCAGEAGTEVIGTASDGAAALAMVRDLAPDLLLLDVAMPGVDGIAVARAVAGADGPAIVFVTAHDAFAVLAFELAAIDYLLKPVRRERLATALDRVRARPRRASVAAAAELWIPHLGGLLRLDPARIELIEAERDYVRVHAGGRSYLLRATINALEHRLAPDGFLRVHRSVLVPRRRVAGLQRLPSGTWSATLDDGGHVPVGRAFLARLRAAP